MATEHLIVLTGCSGGGKSTLLEALAARGYAVVPEPGRAIVREELAAGGTALPWADGIAFARRCVERGLAAYERALTTDGLVFFDRSILDNIGGCERVGLTVPPEWTAALERCRYAQHVFLAPPWPDLFQQDTERRHSFAAAVEEYDTLVEFYTRWRYTLVTLPRCSVAERVAFVEEQLGC